MDRERAPQPELRVRETCQPADWRKDEERDGIEEKHGSQRDGDLVLSGLEDRNDGCDGAASTDRCTDADEDSGVSLDEQDPIEHGRQCKRGHDPRQGVENAVRSHARDDSQIHASTEAHDRERKQRARRLASPGQVRVADRKRENEPEQKAKAGGHERKEAKRRPERDQRSAGSARERCRSGRCVVPHWRARFQWSPNREYQRGHARIQARRPITDGTSNQTRWTGSTKESNSSIDLFARVPDDGRGAEDRPDAPAPARRSRGRQRALKVSAPTRASLMFFDSAAWMRSATSDGPDTSSHCLRTDRRPSKATFPPASPIRNGDPGTLNHCSTRRREPSLP